MHLITVSKNYFIQTNLFIYSSLNNRFLRRIFFSDEDNDDDARGSFDEHHSRLFVPSQVFFENNDENEWKIHIAPKGED